MLKETYVIVVLCSVWHPKVACGKLFCVLQHLYKYVYCTAVSRCT